MIPLYDLHRREVVKKNHRFGLEWQGEVVFGGAMHGVPNTEIRFLARLDLKTKKGG